MCSSTSSPPAAALGHPYPLVARVQALHRRAVGPVDQALALEARHVLVEAEVDDRLDRLARPLVRHRPVHRDQLVPQGAPHLAPTAIGSRGAARPSATGTGSPGATQIDAVSGTDSG